jgi:hypothetical protein
MSIEPENASKTRRVTKRGSLKKNVKPKKESARGVIPKKEIADLQVTAKKIGENSPRLDPCKQACSQTSNQPSPAHNADFSA